MTKKIIGIDPGKDTGLAIFENKILIETRSINTYEAIKFLQDNKQDIDYIVIESSTKQSFIWNKNNKSANALGRHARNIGSVDGVVRTLLECCEAENINVKTISPLQKGKKWDAVEFKQYFQEYTKRTNQHERDAAICVIKARLY